MHVDYPTDDRPLRHGTGGDCPDGVPPGLLRGLRLQARPYAARRPVPGLLAGARFHQHTPRTPLLPGSYRARLSVNGTCISADIGHYATGPATIFAQTGAPPQATTPAWTGQAVLQHRHPGPGYVVPRLRWHRRDAVFARLISAGFRRRRCATTRCPRVRGPRKPTTSGQRRPVPVEKQNPTSERTTPSQADAGHFAAGPAAGPADGDAHPGSSARRCWASPLPQASKTPGHDVSGTGATSSRRAWRARSPAGTDCRCARRTVRLRRSGRWWHSPNAMRRANVLTECRR